MGLFIRNNGIWNESIAGPSVRVDGVNRDIYNGYVSVSGTWRQFYARDTVGPASPTGLVATWNNGNCVVTWTNPADADYSFMKIYRTRIGVQTETYITQISSPTATWTDTAVQENGVIYRYTLYPVDVRGNMGNGASVDSMAWTGAARGRVASPITFYPTDSGTYRNSIWRTDVTNRVFQGYTANGMNYGHYFYGSQFFDTLRGTTVSAMSLLLVRSSSSGLGAAVQPHIWAHGKTTKTGDGSSGLYNGSLLSPGLARNGSAPNYQLYTLSSSYHSGFFDVSPATRYRGFATYDSDTTLNGLGASDPYMQLQGFDEIGFGLAPGAVSVTHSG